MSKKRSLSFMFGLMNHLLAWVVPVGFILYNYGFFINEGWGRLLFMGIVAIAIALRFLMYRLKTVADEGYGMSKELAREVRFIIPIGLMFALITMISMNISNLSTVLHYVLLLNIVAVPFRLISYRLSARYENDVAPKKTIDFLTGK